MTIKGNIKKRGAWGEAVASWYLTIKGFSVVDKNYRSVFGEIDLIVQKKKLLVFTEVKCRMEKKGEGAEKPEKSVNNSKIKKIRKTARCFIRQKKLNPDCDYRFDVISIIIKKRSFSIKHIVHAF